MDAIEVEPTGHHRDGLFYGAHKLRFLRTIEYRSQKYNHHGVRFASTERQATFVCILQQVKLRNLKKIRELLEMEQAEDESQQDHFD